MKAPLFLKRLLCFHLWNYSGKPNNLVEGIWRIYNETPIRQNRAFPHYGMSLETIALKVNGDGFNIHTFVYPDNRTCTLCERDERHVGNGVFKKIG